MNRFWSFDRRHSIALLLFAALAAIIVILAVFAVRASVRSEGAIESGYARDLNEAGQIQNASERRLSNARAFLLTRDIKFLAASAKARTEFLAGLSRLEERDQTPEDRRLLGGIEKKEQDSQRVLDQLLLERMIGEDRYQVARDFERTATQPRAELERAIDSLIRHKRAQLSEAERAAERLNRRAWILQALAAFLLFILLGAMALVVRRAVADAEDSERKARLETERAEASIHAVARIHLEREANTRFVLDSALDGLILTNSRGTIRRWNAVAEAMFGWTAVEVVGMPLAETILPSRVLGSDEDCLSETLASGEGPLLHGRDRVLARRKDGSEFPIEVSIARVLLDGEVQYNVFVRDVGERERAETALRQSEERYRSLASATTSIVFTTDPVGAFLSRQAPWEEQTGQPWEQYAQWGWLEAIHPEDRDRVAALWRATVAAGGDFETTTRIWNAPSRRYRYFLARAIPVRTPEGAVREWVGTLLDVDDTERARRSLLESEQRFRELADSAPVLIWTSGTDKRYSWFNRPWLDFTGRALEEELGDGWVEGVHPEDLDDCVQAYHSAFEAREPFEREYRLHRPDGTWSWVLDYGNPVYDAEGTFTGYIGSCIDVTDRRNSVMEREDLLARERLARADAERASRMKDEFLATLSHELRTPLQAILGWSKLLRTEGITTEVAVRGIDVIERNAVAQTRLIEEMLEMNRIISGKLRLELQPLDLKDVVEAALETMRPAAQAKGVRLESTLDPQAGPVSGDGHRLQQVVWNLLSNAIKFTPRAGQVSVSLSRNASHVQIRVVDTGQGINSAFLPHVFERFRQEDPSTTRSQSGLGLGLAIVRQLVELHGGHASAVSDGEGMGATFIISLPIAAPVGDDAPGLDSKPAVESEGGASVPEAALSGLRVLVVEDDADSRDLIRRVLEEAGARVTSEASAAAAFETFQTLRPDVLLSDIAMPHEDGYALVARIRSLPLDRGGTTPAVALTAFARREDRARALRAGFEAHLAKPIEPARLVASIVRVTKPRPRAQPEPA